MLFVLNDMGFASDGRFLDRASMDAGSAVLKDLDGNLRPSDIGKNIAVPGVVDLHATIVALIDRMDVSASMQAGSTALTIAPSPPPPATQVVFTSANVGQRITVEGAGPGNSTLVTDVASFRSKTMIELAVPAATTVTGAPAILNRRDRVALSDYARGNANGQKIQLSGGRTVTDGSMTMGGAGLDSPTANFCSLDLDPNLHLQQTIQGAGFLLTTVLSFQSTRQVTLAAAATSKLTGLADIWKTDSRPAFEQLLAGLESSNAEGAEVLFGPGVYDFSAGAPLRAQRAGMTVNGLNNLTLRGAGPGATILRLMPAQKLADTHIIRAYACRNLTIRDLSLHGAYLTMGVVNPQMHGILVEGGEEINIANVRVFQSSGDGIRLIGQEPVPPSPAPYKPVSKVWINGCRLTQNKRTGVCFQRAVEFVWIRDCYIELTPPTTDDAIHFEPSGAIQAPTDIVIDGNVIDHGTATAAALIEGNGGTNPTLRVKFTNNTLRNGALHGINVQDITVTGNTITASQQGQAINFRGTTGACSDLRFSHNRIVATGKTKTGLLIASEPPFTEPRLDRIEPHRVAEDRN